MNPRLEFLRKKNLNKTIQKNESENKPTQLIAKAHSNKRRTLRRQIEKLGEITHEYEHIPYLSFKCEASEAHQLASTFHQLSDRKAYREIAASISAIDASSTFSIPINDQAKPASTHYGTWNLEQIGTYPARKHATGNGVTLAILDTGVDYTHPEVSRNFGNRKGIDLVQGNDKPMDQNGHGTHVAGIAVGKTYGIAVESQTYSVRVLDENGSGSEADTIAGLDWIAKNKIDVVNISLGSPYASSALEDMCYYLANNGTLIAAAAGNSGYGPSYPAAFGDPVIAVAATDKSKNHADFSNIYDTNDISAPGVGITSSYLDGYATLSGTSMASPHVAGCLALVLSALKRNADIDELLESTAEHLERGRFPERDVYGAGLIRVDKMIEKTLAATRTSASEANYGREILNVIREVFWE